MGTLPPSYSSTTASTPNSTALCNTGQEAGGSTSSSPSSFCAPSLPPPLFLHPPPYASWCEKGSSTSTAVPLREAGRDVEKDEKERKSEPENLHGEQEKSAEEEASSSTPHRTINGEGSSTGDDTATPVVATTSSAAPSPLAAPPPPPPLVGQSFLLWSPFIPSTVDLHRVLLLEANEKHGVDVDVPPQAPPLQLSTPSSLTNPVADQENRTDESLRKENEEVEEEKGEERGESSEHGDTETQKHSTSVWNALLPSLFHPPLPTAVPNPYYPPPLAVKMKDVSSHFQYTPTHGPPPLHTTGSHGLADSFRLGSDGSRGGGGGHPSQLLQRSWRVRYQRALHLRQTEWKAIWHLYQQRLSGGEMTPSLPFCMTLNVSSSLPFFELKEEDKLAKNQINVDNEISGAPTELFSSQNEGLVTTTTAASSSARNLSLHNASHRGTPLPPSSKVSMAPASSSTTNTSDDEIDVIRAPIQEGMRYHCVICGRGYRKEHIIEEHIRLRHEAELLAAVTTTSSRSLGPSSKQDEKAALAKFIGDGAGKGEIMAVITNTSSSGLGRMTTTTAGSNRKKGVGEEGGSTPVKAAPAGAARALKRRVSTTLPCAVSGSNERKKGAVHAATISSSSSTGSAASSLQRLSIRERSLMYANPFGPAAEAAAEAAKLEEQEPVNPFKVCKEGEEQAVDGEGSNSSHYSLKGIHSSQLGHVETTGEEGRGPGGESAERGKGSTASESSPDIGLGPEYGISATPHRFYCPLCLRPAPNQSSFSTGEPPHPHHANIPPRSVHWKPFSCRLLDRLFDHLDEAHSDEGGVDALDDRTLAALYEQQNYPWKRAYTPLPRSPSSEKQPPHHKRDDEPHSSTLLSHDHGVCSETAGDSNMLDHREMLNGKMGPAKEKVHISSLSDDNLERKESDMVGAGASPSTASVTTKTSTMASSSLSPAPAPPPRFHHISLRIHSRLFCNTLLKGIVADVQHGYLAKRLVLQYVVKVIGREGEEAVALIPSLENSLQEGGHTKAEEIKEGEKNLKAKRESEEELIVVRYQGEPTSLTALRSSIHVGTHVLAVGNLRLDRRLDAVSKRYHAYPVVIVVPPYGFIRAIS